MRWVRELGPYFIVGLALFAALVAASTRFIAQLLAVIVGAALNTWAYQNRQQRQLADITSRYQLSPLPHARWMRVWFVVSKYLSSAGFLGVTWFTARLAFG